MFLRTGLAVPLTLSFSPHDTGRVSCREAATPDQLPFAPYDFGAGALPNGPLELRTPGRVPPEIGRLAASIREYLAVTDGLEDSPHRPRTVLRVADVGPGLELWFLRFELVYTAYHRHVVREVATGRVGEELALSARWWDLADEVEG